MHFFAANQTVDKSRMKAAAVIDQSDRIQCLAESHQPRKAGE